MRYCKTKILAQPIPSMRDVEEAKCEKIMEQLDQIIEEVDLTKMVNLLDAQINNGEYTAMDLAAAFLYQALGKAEREVVKQDAYDFSDTGAEEGMVRLFVNIGKKQHVRPGDILGAVAGESGMPGDLVGAIDMYDGYTFVEVPREYGAAVLKAMKNAKIKGRSISVEPANAK
jgi:ATP-dependent RNA helicase DeaD